MKIKLNKKLLLSILCLIIVCIISVSIFLLVKNSGESKLNYDLQEDKRLSVRNCEGDEYCPYSAVSYYDTFVLDGDYPKLQKKINKINKDTKKLYNIAKNSKTDSEVCADVRDILLHRLGYKTDYYSYETDELISVAVERTNYDMCTDVALYDKAEAYIYDKKADKLISQEEFKKREKITDKEIRSAIELLVNQFKSNGEDITLYDNYDDIVLFYGSQGQIFVSFEIKELNGYFAAIVRKSNN